MNSPDHTPIVSVVIPTAGRPELLLRAISSVLAQTVQSIELVVVVDGACEETRAALRAGVTDPRVRIIVNGGRKGGAESRNIGVRAARATWVAFLDDDDEWLPRKLEQQLAAAAGSSAAQPIVTGRLVAEGPWGQVVWPRRLPSSNESIGEYLFVRRSLTQGEALVSTITLLASRQLLLDVPFAANLPRHQEWDWLLRATARGDAELVWVDEPIALWHVATTRSSISRNADWRNSLQWMRDRAGFLNHRARAGFVATVAAGACRAQGQRRAIVALAREMCAARCTDPRQWALLFMIALAPEGPRRTIQRLMRRRNTPAAPLVLAPSK